MRTRLLLLTALALLAVPSTAAAESFGTPGPTGFSPPAAPSSPPTISGSAQTGGTLTGTRGTWQAGTSLAGRWLRCSAAVNSCQPTGDTDLSYTVTPADIGSIIKLRVVGTGAGGGTRTADAQTAVIPPPTAQVSAPVNRTPPQILGQARVGELLSATTGTWTGTDPISYRYVWVSCQGQACRQVSTAQAYRVASADVGRTVSVGVVARNAVGEGFALATTGRVPAVTSGAGLKRLSPFPTLLIGGRVAGSVTSVATLRLRRVAGGATVSTTCKGRGCPFRKATTRVRKGKARSVALRRLQRRMRAGTTVVITVRKGNTLGKYIRLRFRRGLAPARVDRCVAPGSPKPLRCP